MNQLEYLEIIVEDLPVLTKGKVRWLNDEEIPNWKRGSYFIEYFNQLGQYG